MAELEVDQSRLPRVQEVCQCFAVLEDGALAHNLQEQEIEQYYSSNVQRNQLVQNDIRVAKKLQDEEQQRAFILQQQATQQMEEQDSEYARRIQEEIQRCAEEARRREEEDEEIAKQIQEEEELLVRQRSGSQRTDVGENGSVPVPQHTHPSARHNLGDEEERYSHSRAYSPSPSTSDYEEDLSEHFENYRGRVEQRHRPTRNPPHRRSFREVCSRSVSQGSHIGQDHRSSVGQGNHLEQDHRSFVSHGSYLGQDRRSHVGQGNHLDQDRRSSTSQDNHLEQDRRSSTSQGNYLDPDRRSSTSQSSNLEQDRRSSTSQSSNLEQDRRSSASQGSQFEQDRRSSASQGSQFEQDRRSSVSQSSKTGPFQGGWGDVVRLIKNDLNEQGYLSCSSDDELFEPVYRLERILNQRQQPPDHLEPNTRLSRHSSMRETSRTWQGQRTSRTESFRGSEYSDGRSVRSESRRVRRYNSSCSDSRPGDGQRHVHFQDDARRLNSYRDGQRAFEGVVREQNVGTYPVSSYPGRREMGYNQVYPTSTNGGHFQTQPQVRNTQLGRRSYQNRSYSHNEFQQGNGVRHFESSPLQESRAIEEAEKCKRGEHRRRALSLREEGGWESRESRRYSGNRRERRVPQGNEGESSSTEEEEVERERRREERRARRLPQRSLSLACRGRSPRAVPGLRRDGASLDMGELEQVLLDEELARRLQAEEEKLLRGCPQDPQSTSSVQRHYPEGDFRVAQVAQDEEIARFMQKQEIKAKRRSRELEAGGPGGQVYREMNDVFDERTVYDRRVQRERLDSEGLLSPTEEHSPEHQPSSPMQHHQYRNIAEELDPTFHRKENMQTGQNLSGSCQIQASPQAGSYEHSEEPTFVPPTKRHNDKPVRVKTKEKKESTKPKENCKQQ